MEWVVTDNVYQETWRRLLELSNVDQTVEVIIGRHGKPSSRSIQSNYIKQANQIRVSVLQAKEYFDAAKSSSIFTSPNHVYYGFVALASAMMLILGDGSKALDVLRKDRGNSHHGLIFSTGCSATSASTGLSLVQNTYAEISLNGHFMNWYSTIPHGDLVFADVVTGLDERQSHSERKVVGITRMCESRRIAGRKRSMIDLLKYFPDLRADLLRAGLPQESWRTKYTVGDRYDGVSGHQWVIHPGRPSTDLGPLLERFTCESRWSEGFSCVLPGNPISGQVTFKFQKPAQPVFQWPTSRESLAHETISYSADIDTNEIVDCYLVAYQLSMLSRYFPDLWIGCMESHCKAASVIERAVEVLVAKFPLLALSMLHPDGLVISTRPRPG